MVMAMPTTPAARRTILAPYATKLRNSRRKELFQRRGGVLEWVRRPWWTTGSRSEGANYTGIAYRPWGDHQISCLLRHEDSSLCPTSIQTTLNASPDSFGRSLHFRWTSTTFLVLPTNTNHAVRPLPPRSTLLARRKSRSLTSHAPIPLRPGCLDALPATRRLSHLYRTKLPRRWKLPSFILEVTLYVPFFV